MNISFLILAGGKSSRMGFPKGLFKINDRELILHHLDTFFQFIKIHDKDKKVQSTCNIVVGHHFKEYANFFSKKQMPDLLDLKIIHNKDWELGQFSSIKTGISSLKNFSHLFILPVDTAPISIKTLIEITTIKNKDVVIPTFLNKGGHPILISSFFAEKLKSVCLENNNARLDFQIKELTSDKIERIEINDKNIITNINSKNDLV